MSQGINAPYGLRVEGSSIGNGGTDKTKKYYIYTDPTGTVTQPQSIYRGDPVKFGSVVANPAGKILGGVSAGTITPLLSNYLAAGAINDGTAIAIPLAPVADAFVGVFMGCQYYSKATRTLTNSPFWPGGTQVLPGTTIVALINDDPMAIFRAQLSTSTANAENPAKSIFLQGGVTSMVGMNANLALSGTPFTAPVAPNLPTNNPVTGSNETGLSAYYVDGSTAAAGVALDVKIIGLAPITYTNLTLTPGVNMPFVDVLVRFNKHMFGSTGVGGPTIV